MRKVSEMLDSDQRTYVRVLEVLRAFDRQSISLGKVIADLEALLGALSATEEYWKVRMSKHWAVLEDAFADALDKEVKVLPDLHKKLVEEAVRGLEKDVLERINLPPTTEANVVSSPPKA